MDIKKKWTQIQQMFEIQRKSNIVKISIGLYEFTSKICSELIENHKINHCNFFHKYQI